MHSRAAVFLPLLSLFLLFVAPMANAESNHWSYQVGADLCPVDSTDAPTCGGAGITNPFVQINYHTRVSNALTGETIACGSTVPLGIPLKYEFVPHEYTDIDWFASTAAYDSPYGDWLNPIALPDHGNVCKDKNYVGIYNGGGWESGTWKFYSPLVVMPPAQSITGLPDSFGCTTAGDGSKSCTPTQIGTFSGVFNFAATQGAFYLGFNRGSPPARSDGKCDVVSSGCDTSGECTNGAGQPQAGGRPLSKASPIGGSKWANNGPYYLQVPAQTLSCPITIGTPVGQPPGTPTLTAAAAASGGAACVAGTPYTISMSATDPDEDPIRYLVDWNADGTIDEIVPPTGYVPSSTTKTASRTFATAGSKTVQVKSQDDNGNASGWASLTFDCAASNDSTGGAGLGGGLGNGDNGSGSGIPAPDLSLRVVPSLVAKGTTTHVNWSATNVLSCSVTGQNGDTWIGLQSIIGGETSGPITQTTQYTLSCLGLDNTPLSQTATVTVLPVFQEQ